MKKWNCKTCGEVKPKVIYYSCPAQADCPICHARLEDPDGFLKVLTIEEAIQKRPKLYTEASLKKLMEDNPSRYNKEWLEMIREAKINIGMTE
jgi:hypothetical protein